MSGDNEEKVYVPGHGNANAKIVFVGESPSFDEIDALKPFVGPSGKFLDSLLSEAGIHRSDVWITNAVKYFVPFDEKKKFSVRCNEAGIDFQAAINELRTEIQSIRPNIVVPLGGTALYACTGRSGIIDYRGSILSAFGIKSIATYHPAHILHASGEVKGYWPKHVMVFDLKRIIEESATPEIKLPYRNLNICKSAAQLYDFISRYDAKYQDLSVDIEAQNCIPICVGLAFVHHEGICIPLWNRNGISEMDDYELAKCWAILSEILARKRIVGQNFNYDRDKLTRLGFQINDHYDDTMIRAFAIHPELPKNLAFNTSIYTREPFYKNEGMYEGSIGDLLIGCARDACVTLEVRDKQQQDLIDVGTEKFYRNFLMKVYQLYGQKIENTGFRVSEEKRRELIQKYIEWDENLRHDLFSLTGEYINSGSPKQVSDLLYERFKIPYRKGTGEEVLTALLNNTVKKEDQKRAIELILEDRRVKKTLTTYLCSPTDYDGRMKSTFFICLETGRTANGQQDPPIRPAVEGRNEAGQKKKQSRGMAFQTITKHGDVGQDIRSMFVADEGEIFLQADSSQAEARVVFLLAEDYEALKLIDEIDYHAHTAVWFFGPNSSLFDYEKKKLGYEHPIRFMGKTLRHSGHLGASKKSASMSVNTDARKYKIKNQDGTAINMSEKEAEKHLKTFHEKQPKIRNVFHAGIKRCIEKDRILRAPVPYGIDADNGGTRMFLERYGDDLFRQAYSYIPQRTVSENTKGAALRIDQRIGDYCKIIVESHDALLVSVPIEQKIEACKVIKEEFERPIDFSKCSLERGQLVIPCEIEEGFDYYNLRKSK